LFSFDNFLLLPFILLSARPAISRTLTFTPSKPPHRFSQLVSICISVARLLAFASSYWTAESKWQQPSEKDDKDEGEGEVKKQQKNQATFKCAPPLFYLKNAKHLLGFALLHFYLFSLQRSFSPLRPGLVLLLALSFNLFYIAASFSCATANARSKPNAI